MRKFLSVVLLSTTLCAMNAGAGMVADELESKLNDTATRLCSNLASISQAGLEHATNEFLLTAKAIAVEADGRIVALRAAVDPDVGPNEEDLARAAAMTVELQCKAETLLRKLILEAGCHDALRDLRTLLMLRRKGTRQSVDAIVTEQISTLPIEKQEKVSSAVQTLYDVYRTFGEYLDE